MSPHVDESSVSLCVTLSLMPALLPKSDEFAMNFEGLDTFFRHMRCFPQHFCELGVNLVEKGRPRQWEPKEPHRARPYYRLGLLGSPKASSALSVPFDNSMEGNGGWPLWRSLILCAGQRGLDSCTE